jgi:hypothetical protein
VSYGLADCYARATTARDWAPPSQVARALRGQGVQFVDLERLDEAEAVLRESLELDPDSETARNELLLSMEALPKSCRSRLFIRRNGF